MHSIKTTIRDTHKTLHATNQLQQQNNNNNKKDDDEPFGIGRGNDADELIHTLNV